MNTWTPLWSKVVDSSLWLEPDHVVKVFITLLALKDRDHVVRKNAFELARKTNKTEAEVLEALGVLSAPDTRRLEPQEFDGRRIEKVDGGWLILNGERYRLMMQECYRAEYKRVKQAEYRANQPTLKVTDQCVLDLTIEWNKAAELAGFSQCIEVSADRLKSIGARMRDPFFTENWRQALTKMSTSEFCKGKNTRGWVADFDFFVRPDSVVKIMEGKYDNRAPHDNRPMSEGGDRNPESNRKHLGQYDHLGKA